MIVGASSDTEAMVKIMRYLDDGYVLTQVNLCRPTCPVPVHLHFTRSEIRNDSEDLIETRSS